MQQPVALECPASPIGHKWQRGPEMDDKPVRWVCVRCKAVKTEARE